MAIKPPHKRKRPARLPAKLLEIRQKLDESQGGILKRMNLDGEFERDYVSKWERGVMEPPLHVLLAYAEVVNIFLEILVRDDIKLPDTLPTKIKSIDDLIER